MSQFVQEVFGALLGDYPIVFLGVVCTLVFCPKPWLVLTLIPVNVAANLALIMVMHKRVIGWYELEHHWLASGVAVLVFSIVLGMFIRTALRGPIPIRADMGKSAP